MYIINTFVMLGLIALTTFQLPFAQPETTLPTIEISEVEARVETTGKLAEDNTRLVAAFFGKAAPEHMVNSIIEKKKEFISTRPAYPASLKVIQKHENTIRQKAAKYGVPSDVALGVGLLENGGGETKKSGAGALGIFQLMPSTARSLGLTVNKKVDERRDPVKNIDAGMRYLSSNYQRFGDWGLATWAYHAGEGNVAKAVKLYFKEKHNINLKGLKDAGQMKKHIEKHDATVYKVLSSSSVKKFTKKLNDDSSGYPYKVLATANLFKKITN